MKNKDLFFHFQLIEKFGYSLFVLGKLDFIVLKLYKIIKIYFKTKLRKSN